MDENIPRCLAGIKVGAQQSHENMTVYCLLAAEEADVDFATLDEALNAGFLSVTELGEAGHVPELKVVNRSDQKVLLLDGEELVGAKQNRVLNVTILIAPQSETVIPVSCVEQGRWSYRSQKFGSESRAMSAQLRKRKSETVSENLRHGRQFRSDQGVVWEEIENKYARMSAERSPTMAMADLYESHRDLSNEYVTAFRPVDKQIGMVVFIDGQIAGLEVLTKFETFKKMHSKLVNNYVMDALETVHSEQKTANRSMRANSANLLSDAQSAGIEVRESVALRRDLRIQSNEVIGAGLEFEGNVLQLSIFARGVEDGSGRRSGRLSASKKRRNALRTRP